MGKRNRKPNLKTYSVFLLAAVLFVLFVLFLPDTFSYQAKLMTAIVSFGIVLWAFEPIPLGLTGVIILVFMLVLQAADPAAVYSGFSSPAILLIVGGMMLAKAANETALIKRVTYQMLKKWGGTANGLVGSLVISQQIQAIFIPTTAVRSTLMVPIATMIDKTLGARPNSNLRKLIMFSVVFGGNISGTAIMTAAIGNVLTVELLERYANVKITYFEWFFYTFPIWFLLIPSMWFLLVKSFPLPKEQRTFPQIKTEMEERLKELGPISREEIRCLLILLFTFVLWVSEPLHGMHPSIPALICVVLMTLPGIGFAKWENIVKINYNTILLISVTLSMGYAFVDSGAADTISYYLSREPFLTIVQKPIMAIVFIVIATQLFHKVISNVATAVVTLLPIMISLAHSAGVSPLALGFTTGLTSLYGFLLIVETMPNLIVHSSGLVSQRDFLKPGFYATLVTMVVTIFVAMTWWKWIGLI